jgi:DNA-directed RNA polymerase subunit E'/Rpb7
VEELFLTDGVVRATVLASLMVFCPYSGVIMTAVVSEIGSEWLRLKTNFCDCIYVLRADWGKCKFANLRDGVDGLLLVEKGKSFWILKEDRVRFRVIKTTSSERDGLRVSGSIEGDFLGPLPWFLCQDWD